MNMLLTSKDSRVVPLMLLNYFYALPNRFFAISIPKLDLDNLLFREEAQDIIKFAKVILITILKFVFSLSLRTEEYRHFALKLRQVFEISLTYCLVLVVKVGYVTDSYKCIVMANNYFTILGHSNITLNYVNSFKY